jgi:hypothetical protein
MSDEKRQTRLLPFRLRRAPRANAGASGEEDFSADAELTALLRTWDAPAEDAGARTRLLADFRANVRRPPLWRRALAAQVRVPLPLAACVGLALLGSLYVLGARATARVEPAAVQAVAQPAAVRFVEVPVVQERVVKQVVYVEKKERGAGRGVSTRADGRGELARRDDKNERGAGTSDSQTPAPGQDAHAGYFTRVDMNDFQPAGEVKFRIVSRGGTDEK